MENVIIGPDRRENIWRMVLYALRDRNMCGKVERFYGIRRSAKYFSNFRNITTPDIL